MTSRGALLHAQEAYYASQPSLPRSCRRSPRYADLGRGRERMQNTSLSESRTLMPRTTQREWPSFACSIVFRIYAQFGNLRYGDVTPVTTTNRLVESA